MTTTDHLLETVSGGVAVLTMNRPEALNALSRPMLTAMHEALLRLSGDDTIGCVVMTGSGRGFCAGGDVKAMAEGTETAALSLDGKAHQLRDRMEVSRLLHEMPKPTIAMVNGPAAGAGLSIALACDMRFMAAGARLSTAFANVGYSGDFGGSYFLSQLVGTAKARELYFLPDRIDADTALRLGIVNRVYPDDQLQAETLAVAQRLASGPRVAYRYMKRNFNAAESQSLSQVFDLEAWGHTRSGETEDHKEAAKAFVEKRTPVFKGR
jgi:2-(1,2-epoxy-1,2-dihydrophenyl)acetyl-CoA isomerase